MATIVPGKEKSGQSEVSWGGVCNVTGHAAVRELTVESPEEDGTPETCEDPGEVVIRDLVGRGELLLWGRR